jgi:hypothetical protein
MFFAVVKRFAGIALKREAVPTRTLDDADEISPDPKMPRRDIGLLLDGGREFSIISIYFFN